MRHPALGADILVSTSEDQKAIAAENSDREFIVKRKAQLTRQPEKPLAQSIPQLNGARRVEPVEDLVACIVQRLQGRFFAKKVKMAVAEAALQKGVFAEYRLHRNMK